MSKIGYIHIYTGNGKGKTTAALGLALRAAGHGMKVFIGQFMKGQYYGELASLELIPDIDIEQFGDEGCITRSQVTAAHVRHARKGLNRIHDIMQSLKYDVVIMDEICVAIWFGLVSTESVCRVMEEKPPETELILTGRYAPDSLIDKADLVTRMEGVRHYYETMGVEARRGIEN